MALNLCYRYITCTPSGLYFVPRPIRIRSRKKQARQHVYWAWDLRVRLPQLPSLACCSTAHTQYPPSHCLQQRPVPTERVALFVLQVLLGAGGRRLFLLLPADGGPRPHGLHSACPLSTAFNALYFSH
jgi:hypothetical protein